MESVKPGTTLQYSLTYSLKEETRSKENKVIYTEKLVPSDTTIGAYYNITTPGSGDVKIYNGAEHFNYSRQYTGEGTVVRTSKAEDPLKFEDMEIEFDGRKGIIPNVANTSYSDFSFAGLKDWFRKYLQQFNCERIEDSTINGVSCYRLRFTSGDVPDWSKTLSFDKKTFRPAHYVMHSLEQTREAFYSDYKIIKAGEEKLFTKKAFPQSYKYVSDIPRKDITLPAGTPAPDIEFTTLEGEKHKLSEYRGMPVLLWFTEIGCPGCLIALPKMIEFAKEFKDIKVIGGYPNDGPKELTRFRDKKRPAFDIFYDSAKEYKKYGVGAYPSFFIIDGNGVITYSSHGGSDYGMEIIRKEILKALKKSLAQ